MSDAKATAEFDTLKKSDLAWDESIPKDELPATLWRVVTAKTWKARSIRSVHYFADEAEMARFFEAKPDYVPVQIGRYELQS
jgi:hypothetical protein